MYSATSIVVALLLQPLLIKRVNFMRGHNQKIHLHQVCCLRALRLKTVLCVGTLKQENYYVSHQFTDRSNNLIALSDQKVIRNKLSA